MTAPYADLSPDEVEARRRSDDPPVLLDVREDWERTLASIPGSVHMPMAQVPRRFDELPIDRPVVVVCHHGNRSQAVADFLSRQGFDRLANLRGGIDEWSRTVDPQIPRY